MTDVERPARPGVLNLVSLISLLWSVLGLIWFGVVTLLALGAAAASWLGGPVVGSIGTLVGAVIVAITGLKSLLSLVLFVAAVRTWSGEPSGRTLHRTWAWITVAADVLDLIFTAGLDPSAWWGLVYAALVLYVTNWPEVVDYFYGNGPAFEPDRGLKPPPLDVDGF